MGKHKREINRHVGLTRRPNIGLNEIPKGENRGEAMIKRYEA